MSGSLTAVGGQFLVSCIPFARGSLVIWGTIWKKSNKTVKKDELNRNLLPKVAKTFSSYCWTCKLHFHLSKIFMIAHEQEFHMHGGGVKFSYGRDLGILLWNSGKWRFPSFLFQLIVQIQGHCWRESGAIVGEKYSCFLFVFPWFLSTSLNF